ncbi:MAG: succinate dehydrogenase cytochrome b subunit [Actinocatenispora sp.]
MLRTLWHSTVGKKAVMATTGVAMLLFLLAHMAGNLKFFLGADAFNGYSAWLRTIGEPILPYSWYLWLQRAVLVGCLAAHVVAAAQLSRRDLRARPQRYRHRQRARASFATRTMRYGGVILFLFVVWHLLDLTVGAVNPRGEAGHPYQNVIADFQVWWITLIYVAAMLMLCLHIYHGFWSAAQTLGANSAARNRLFTATAVALALVITVGFLSVPVAVLTGAVG